MRFISLRAALLVSLSIVLFAGGLLFAQPPGPPDLGGELSKFQDIELNLARLVISGKEIMIPNKVRITLMFRKAEQISGRSAVNNYAGAFTVVPNGGIAVRLTIATQMAGPPQLMELERKYFDALSQVNQILLKPGRVTLQDEKNLLEFTVSGAR